MIPQNVRRFSLRDLFMLTTSLAVGFAFTTVVPGFGLMLLIAIAGYWFGIAILFLSDTMDERQIDQRKFLSAMLSVVGTMTCFFAVVFGGTYFFVSLLAIFKIIPVTD